MSDKEEIIPFPKPKDDQGIFEALYETFTLFVDHLEGRKEPRVLLAYPKIRFNRNVDINWDALGERAADPAAWPTFDQADIFSDIERVQVTITKEEGKLLPVYNPPPRTFYLNQFKPIDESKNLYWAYQPIDSKDAAVELNSFLYLRGLTYDIVNIIKEDRQDYTIIKGIHNKNGIEDYLLPDSLMKLSHAELHEKMLSGIEIPEEYRNRLLSKAPADIQEKAKKQDYSKYQGEISPGLSWAKYNRVQDESKVSGYVLGTIREYHAYARRVIGWKIPFDGTFSSDMLNYSRGDVYIDDKTGNKYRKEYDPLIEVKYGDSTLYFNILPLTIDPIAKEAYYHFVVSIGLKEGTPALDERTARERKKIWAGLLKEIKKNLPESIPTPEVKLPIAKHKVSEHYINSKLQHSYGKNSHQLSLFDALQPETKRGDITPFEPYKNETIVEGIRLTTREDSTMNAIIRLLKKKSTGNNNYTGNLPAEKVNLGGKEYNAPQIGASLHEIAVEVYEQNYSGRDLELLRETLTTLDEKRFLITYKKLNPDGKTKTIVEHYSPLIKVYGLYRDVSQTEEQSKSYRKRGELAIALNPVLIDQIDTNFIEYPIDIDRRTILAAEALNGRYPPAVIRLRDFLIREISHQNRSLENNKKGKNGTAEVNEEKLPYVLGLERYISEGRRKLIKQNTEKAFKAVTALGLVSKIDRVIGAEGQYKYVFCLNLEWK